jgi:NADH-ubiquinone oxidoreductase chain 5
MAFGHNVTYKILDRGLIEYVGPTGIVKALKNTTTFLSQLQSGMVYNYAFVLFLATTLILITINNQIYIEFLVLLPLFAFIVYNQENKV